MSHTYWTNEIFYSVQGEGAMAGHAMTFVRLAGCNMKCDVEPGPKSPGGFACDTEFASGRNLSARQIVEEALRVGNVARMREKYGGAWNPWLSLTGGEPMLQVDTELMVALHNAGFRTMVETNGTVHVPKQWFNHVVVSPKVAEHAVKADFAHELRYVRGYGQAIPQPAITEGVLYRYISPAHDGPTVNRLTVQWCIELVKENPQWQMSVQQHKVPWQHVR